VHTWSLVTEADISESFISYFAQFLGQDRV
jgi:hypothetical protein